MDDAAERLRAAAAAAAAAAELKPVSRTRYLAYVALAMLIQCLWGLYGVCTRYLQTESSQTVPTLQLAVVLTVVAGAGLVLFIAVPTWVLALYSAAAVRRASHPAAAQQAGKGGVQPPQADGESGKLPPLADAESGKSSLQAAESGQVVPQLQQAVPAVGRTSSCAQASDHMLAALMLRSTSSYISPAKLQARPSVLQRASTAAERAKERRRAWLVSYGTAAVIGSLVAFQALTLIYACRYVEAYLVQLIMMLTPLLTALANRFLLKQPTPVGLWPTMAVAVGGSAMMISGEWLGDRGAGADAGGPSGRDMAIGLALAVASMLLLTAYLVMLQVTQHLVTGLQVMWANTYVLLLLLTPIALAVEGTDWSWVLHLTPFAWCVLVFAGFFIDALNTIWTQQCSRVLGAAVVAVFIALRLVSSLIGSIVLLGDVPRSALAWAGFATVLVAMTLFFWLQHRAGKRAAAAAEAEAEAERARQAAPAAAGEEAC